MVNFIVLPLFFFGLKLSVLVWVSGQLKRRPAPKPKMAKKIALMTSFDLENVETRSRTLHQKDFLWEPTHPQSWIFLALLGAEIAGGISNYMPLPPL